jgi:hypothetical protein
MNFGEARLSFVPIYFEIVLEWLWKRTAGFPTAR